MIGQDRNSAYSTARCVQGAQGSGWTGRDVFLLVPQNEMLAKKFNLQATTVKVMLRVSDGSHEPAPREDSPASPLSRTSQAGSDASPASPAAAPAPAPGPGPATSDGTEENGRAGSHDGASAAAAAATSSFFSVDARRKQVTLFDPAACGGSSAPEDRRIGVTAPKMFAFDAIFAQDASQTEICSSALIDVIHAVINGSDGCLFCFGHAKLGKTYTMLGSPQSVNTLGVIPCAISWLFCGINEQKHKTGARFSVRVSAVEIEGSSHKLRDLLADYVSEKEPSSGVYLRDDPLFGTQLQNQSEIRVPSAEKAALYLDAALNSRSSEDGKDSHFLYTLHVYQYSVGGKGGVAGGRSRLHLIDLGSCERGKTSSGIPLSGLGNVLLAIFNGQKHLPYREHKVTQLLKECLGSLTCHAAMIAHVSPYAQHYTDTLATVQLASRIHRMRRRKIKLWSGSSGSGGSSGEEAVRLQMQENECSTGSSDVEPSSSEQSADTVIYVGPSDDATDGEHPPVYIPSLNSGDYRCAIGRAFPSSCAEHRSMFGCPRNLLDKSLQGEVGKGVLMQKTFGGCLEDQSNYSYCNAPSKASVQSESSKTGSTGHQCSNKTSPVRLQNKVAVSKSSGNGSDPLLTSVGKIPKSSSNLNGTISGSDEQWIDGPRISKSKVAEARNLLKDNHKKKETWIDGPMQQMNEHCGVGYGFMDSHKESMIRKWVENQSVQIQQVHKPAVKAPSSDSHSCEQSVQVRSAKETLASKCNVHNIDELKSSKFELINNSDIVSSKEPITSFINSNRTKNSFQLENKYFSSAEYDIIEKEILHDSVHMPIPATNGLNVETEDESRPRNIKSDIDNNVDKEDCVEESETFTSAEQIDPHNHKISQGASDVNLKNLQDIEELRCSMDDNEVEIIEVEEPGEPVPTQDYCLQVTEEDIAFSMSELENSFIDDQQNSKEHLLNILRQESLTIVSTSTDSLSSATDLDHSLPGQHQGITMHSNDNTGPRSLFNLHKLSDDYVSLTDLDLYASAVKKKHESENDLQYLVSSDSHFCELAKLHDLYRHKMVGSSSTLVADASHQSTQYHPSSRCQYFSLSDMLHGFKFKDHPNTCIGLLGNNSLFMEPTCVNYVSREQFKMCDNCKKRFTQSAKSSPWYPYVLHKNKKDLHRLSLSHDNPYQFHKNISIDTCNISSLLHSDRSCNLHSKEEIRKGGSMSDYRVGDNEACHETARTLRGSQQENETPSLLLFPPLSAPVSPRLHRKVFSKTCAKLKDGSICGEEFDSIHDSPSSRPAKESFLSQWFAGKPKAACGSSGYESAIRDSSSSSFGSSQDSDHGSQPEFYDSGKLETSPGTSRRTNLCSRSNKVPVLQYCKEDVQRLERRWIEVQCGKIRELRKQQEELKEELAEAKSRLLIPATRWSYELHVEANMDHRNPSFLEALQRETEILRKRVLACKSHILIVTCFDSVQKSPCD
ncbi:Kinesin-like protein CG14535 [Gryllus bimaculatus]|nr:Kinesin-like protein CG14535 [Gryllus bimaculatus]